MCMNFNLVALVLRKRTGQTEDTMYKGQRLLRMVLVCAAEAAA